MKTVATFEVLYFIHCLLVCKCFQGRDKPKTVLSMCFGENDQVVTGDSNGTISIWDPRTCKTTKQVRIDFIIIAKILFSL